MKLFDAVIREQEFLLRLAQEMLDQHLETIKFYREEVATTLDPSEAQQATRIADEMERAVGPLEQYRDHLSDYVTELKRRSSQS